MKILLIFGKLGLIHTLIIFISVSSHNTQHSQAKTRKKKIPKQLNSDCETKSKIISRVTGFSKKRTPGLWMANKKTSHIMDSFEFVLFSTHVRNKKHPGRMVFQFSENFDQVIRKVEAILDIFFSRKSKGKDDNSEVRILESLKKRLKKHKCCKTCTSFS